MNIDPNTAVSTADENWARTLGASTHGLVLSVLRASPECVKLLTPDGRLRFMSENGRELMQIEDFSAVENRKWTDLWPPESTPTLEDAMARARAGEIVKFEAPCPTAAGDPRWWHVSVSPVYGPSGEVEWLLSSSRDITQRVERERQLTEANARLAEEIAKADVLRREADHRVRNSFALIAGLLRMQARATEGEARSGLEEAAQRIATIARVHERLYRDIEAGVIRLDRYIKDLADDLSGAYLPRKDQLETELTAVEVPSDTAIALGLILSELFANAAKHGEPPFRLTLRTDDGEMCLELSDSGEGLPEDFKLTGNTGLGMQVCQAYATQIDGTLTADESETGGAVMRVTAPIPAQS